MQYGSFAEHNANSQADPLESQREVEALQRVVARTSKYVDVYPTFIAVVGFPRFLSRLIVFE